MKNAVKIGAFIAVLVVAGVTANRGYAQDASRAAAVTRCASMPNEALKGSFGEMACRLASGLRVLIDPADDGAEVVNRIAEQLRQRGIAVTVDARLKSGSIADSCCGAHMSSGLSHRRPKIIVDQVPPESIRAAAHDVTCRASEVNVLAVGTCAIN